MPTFGINMFVCALRVMPVHQDSNIMPLDGPDRAAAVIEMRGCRPKREREKDRER